jgi:hypothetical protein
MKPCGQLALWKGVNPAAAVPCGSAAGCGTSPPREATSHWGEAPPTNSPLWGSSSPTPSNRTSRGAAAAPAAAPPGAGGSSGGAASGRRAKRTLRPPACAAPPQANAL